MLVTRVTNAIGDHPDATELVKLYTLIWQRFLASQMESAVYDVTTVDIPVLNLLFRAAKGAVEKLPTDKLEATAKDADRGKNTYPSLMGLAASQNEANRQLTVAVEALAPLGTAARGLQALARFVVERRV